MKLKIFLRRRFEKFAAPWVGIAHRIAEFFGRSEVQNNLLTLGYFSIMPLFLGALMVTWLDFSTWQDFFLSLINPFLIPLALLFVFSAVRFVTCCGTLAKIALYHKRIKDSLKDYIVIKQGCPGAGKSSTGFYETVLKARYLWEDLQYKYWLYKCKIAAGKPFTDVDYKKYQEVAQAMQFYENNPDAVPCLMTNTGCMVGKKRALELTSEMLTQQKPVPAYTAIFLDETGDTLDSQGHGSKAAREVNEIFKYTRHYGEFRITCAEQEASNMLIGARRPASYVEFQHKQTAFLKPLFLMFIYNLVKFSLWMTYYKSIKPRQAVFMLFLENLIDRIGFRLIKQSVIGNQQQEGAEGIITKSRTIVLESALNCVYSDRAYMLGYSCIGDALECGTWGSLLVPRDEIDRRRKLRSELLTSLSESAKRKQPKKTAKKGSASKKSA